MIDSFQGHVSNNPFRENKRNIKTEGGGIAYEMMNCRCGGEDSNRLRCWGWQRLRVPGTKLISSPGASPCPAQPGHEAQRSSGAGGTLMAPVHLLSEHART